MRVQQLAALRLVDQRHQPIAHLQTQIVQPEQRLQLFLRFFRGQRGGGRYGLRRLRRYSPAGRGVPTSQTNPT